MTPEQRDAMREICHALHHALIEDRRAKEQARRDARDGKRPPVAPRPQIAVTLTDEEVIEDIEWLLGSGEYPARIARRIGKSQPALARWLHRRSRHDLAAPFERVTAA